MNKRTSREIRRKILQCLKEKPLTLAQLERKVNTGFRTIKLNCEELEEYGAVTIEKLEEHPKNGKPSYVIHITKQGLSKIEA